MSNKKVSKHEEIKKKTDLNSNILTLKDINNIQDKNLRKKHLAIYKFNELNTLNEFELIGNIEYKTQESKVSIRHKKCQTITTISWKNLFYKLKKNENICKNCKNEKKDDLHIKLSEKIKELSNGEYEILNDIIYQNRYTKLKVKHTSCGELIDINWKYLFWNVKNNLCSCPKCQQSLFKPLTHDEIKKKIEEYDNGEYELLDDLIYKSQMDDIKIRHKPCGTISTCKWKNISWAMNQHRYLCDKCKKNSVGEKIIIEYLHKHNISYSYQKTFSDCKYVKVLLFDFYLNDLNIIIEFDGIQHFEPIKYFGGEECFKEQVEKDNIKNSYCKENNILLFRIPYSEQNNIELLLNKLLESSNKKLFLKRYYKKLEQFYDKNHILF